MCVPSFTCGIYTTYLLLFEGWINMVLPTETSALAVDEPVWFHKNQWDNPVRNQPTNVIS